MLVIADSSPIIVLTKIGQLQILPKLFGRVLIPSAVAAELSAPSRPKEVVELIRNLPEWVRIEVPLRREIIPPLHPGESEAIMLVEELGADLLLVDDRKAYRVAVSRNITAIGTIRVLERAADENLLDLREAFDQIRQTDFWISQALLDDRLAQYERRKIWRDH